ncbi:MAG: hypothetical protein R6V05_01470, partial [Candidatus Brocadiia bacterium]
VAAVVLLALNFHQYFDMRWTTLNWISLGLIPLLVVLCGFLSRRRVCKMQEEEQAKGEDENDEEP